MPGNVVRIFSLYEFFGLFLPGAALLLALIPLSPTAPPDSGVGTGAFVLKIDLTFVLLFIFGGFVVGQAIHSGVKVLEDVLRRVAPNWPYVRSTSDIFASMLEPSRTDGGRPVAVHATVAASSRTAAPLPGDAQPRAFRALADTLFGHAKNADDMRHSIVLFRSLANDVYRHRARPEVVAHALTATPTGELEMTPGSNLSPFVTRQPSTDDPESIPPKELFTLLQSRIHMYERGRSRYIQAVGAFCRSMWFCSLLILFVYTVVALVAYSNTVTVLNYHPVAKQTILHPFWLFAVAASVTVPMWVLFFGAAHRYKYHIVGYLLADFVNLTLDRQQSVETDIS